jgi:hypothetical protein
MFVRYMNRKILIIFLLLLSFRGEAADYSAWAVSTTVELVSGGVLIHGAFGDPNSCGKPNYIFISQQSPITKLLYRWLYQHCMGNVK